ncbi:MAG: hypothetical protein VST72_07010 [Nitrospirota bacterium]|nr:hypothetical protein [Nitrospirota bacterium]
MTEITIEFDWMSGRQASGKQNNKCDGRVLTALKGFRLIPEMQAAPHDEISVRGGISKRR